MPTKSPVRTTVRHSYLGRPSVLSQFTDTPSPEPEIAEKEQKEREPRLLLPVPTASANYDQTATTPWKRYKMYNSPFPRYRHAALTIASDKNELFIMGGLKEGSVFGDTWKIYPMVSGDNTITGFSTELIDVANQTNPPARVGHSSVLCGNAYIVYGGDTVDTDFNGYPDDNLYMFNINNHKYTIPSHLLNKPRGRYGHLIGVVSLSTSSSRLYLFGGQLENDVFNDLYYFELTSFKLSKASWEIAEPVNNFKPPPLTNHSMSVFKHKIYIFGGVYNHEKVSRDLWCYDTLKNTWLQIPTTGDVPLPVNEHSAVLVGEKLYVYGGNDFSGTIYDTLHCLDLRTFHWKLLGKQYSMAGPGPRCGHSMSFIPKLHKLVIMGGDKNDYIYDDEKNFDTYENYDGHEVGTMIYVLDIPLADHFLHGGVPKKMAASAGGAAGVISKRPPSPSPSEDAFTRHRKSLSAGIEDFRTPNTSLERIQHSLDPNLTRTETEDAETATAPAEYQPEESVGDNFVDVLIPSSAISEADINTDTEAAEIENVRRVPMTSGHHASVSRDEDHKSDGPRKSTTPVLAKDFAYPVPSITDEPLSAAGSSQKAKPVVMASEKGNLFSFSSGPETAPEAKENDAKTNKLITDLKAEIASLKESFKADSHKAEQRIRLLEEEKSVLKNSVEELSKKGQEADALSSKLVEQTALVEELRGAINPQDLEITGEEGTSSSRGFTTTTKYKLQNLDLANKLVYLQNENEQYREKLDRFEPFMENQITQLSSLQNVIKAQEERIADLTVQVKLELVLHQEIADWKHKFENLELEFNTYKSLHADVEYVDADVDGSRELESGTQKKNTTSLSSQLGSLVELWQTSKLADTAARLLDTLESSVVSGLQKQVDELLLTCRNQQKSSAEEVQELTSELNAKIESLNVLEEKYREAILSVNNTSKALNVNQEEMQTQKALIEKLARENKDLKMLRKSRRVSSMQLEAGSFRKLSSPPLQEEISDEGEEEDLANAHYQMRVRDLEADIYIIKQERDELNDTVNSLKKELYFAKSNQ